MPINVLVTGGSGFVGRWMHRTQPKDVSAWYLDRKMFEAGDWMKNDYDAIVHLANISPAQVLKHAGDARVLFASSGAVYDLYTPYAYNKRQWEADCIHSERDVVIARLFTFVGAYLKNQYAITNFIDDAANGRPIIVRSSGLSVRSYLYGEQLGQIMWGLLDKPTGFYDIGGKTPYTIIEVARMVAQQFDAYLQVLDTHDSTDNVYLPFNGIEETISLEEAIERTVYECI